VTEWRARFTSVVNFRVTGRLGRSFAAVESPARHVVSLVMDILVTRNLPSSVMARLHALGSVDLYTDGTMPADLLKQRVVDKDALVCLMTDEVDRSVIDAGTRLKIVSNVAVGYNNIDHAYARSRGVVVTNTPDVLTESVADFTWAMILAPAAANTSLLPV